ncbi:hypothetical protein SIN8267_01246 [Sinobacterium norvegicum]|uniref:Uncharacterized protein n=1 Tax=Sinobacterium norvegicum TaxID=1641715 RepID=A0ABM9ADY4_9GAMM|nr:hypothetical protein [Sinobacterium norvegicum]CAH0991144.1 hypothetical protein SIN8267_01246 [Sinobacterium norvegicum]
MIEDVFPHLGELVVEKILGEDISYFAKRLNLPENEIQSVHRQLPLEFPGAPIIFDGFSTLDLGILLKNGKVLPIELKLGYTGLARASVNKMLAPCSVSAHTSEYRVSGKIFSILNRNFDRKLVEVIGGSQLSTRIEGRIFPLADEWSIIARNSVISSWKKLPPDFNSLQKYISIEDICSNYGEDKFNKLISDLLSNINYYDTWLANNA